MLTKDDLKAIGQVIDKKMKPMADDIAAIQARVADIETAQLTKLDSLEIRSMLKAIEKRVTTIEGKLAKFVTKKEFNNLVSQMVTKDDLKNLASKDDLKKALRGVVRKKDLAAMERRFIRKFNQVIDSFDGELVETKERIERVEEHLNLPPVSPL